jgi:hypothetical protein
MPKTTEQRIQEQLDRLDDPNLSERDIDRIKKKIELLREQDQ